MFSESDLAHSDLLRGNNQYVGRSLKVNGSFCRDTYTPSRLLNFATIAEAVTAEHQVNWMIKNQVSYVKGNYYEKPSAAADLYLWYNRRMQ